MSPQALSTVVFPEERDDQFEVTGLVSEERSCLDAAGSGDERVSSERDTRGKGLLPSERGNKDVLLLSLLTEEVGFKYAGTSISTCFTTRAVTRRAWATHR